MPDEMVLRVQAASDMQRDGGGGTAQFHAPPGDVDERKPIPTGCRTERELSPRPSTAN